MATAEADGHRYSPEGHRIIPQSLDDQQLIRMQVEKFGRVLSMPMPGRHVRSPGGYVLESEEERIQRERFNKISAYEMAVARWMAKILADNDPCASMLAAGSFAEFRPNGKPLRVGSDFDMIITSEVLKNPQTYFMFLMQLQEYHTQMIEAGVVPIVFTEIGREEELRLIQEEFFLNEGAMNASPHKPIGDNFLPVHFLYYPTYLDMYRREPDTLTYRLLNAARPLVGNIQRINPGEIVDTYPRGLVQSRWNMERAMAEFVTNYPVLPRKFLLRKVKNVTLATIRGPFGDALYGLGSNANAWDILSRVGGEFPVEAGRLMESIKPMFEVHQNDAYGSRYTMNTFVEPMVDFINLIDAVSRSKRE